MDLELRNKRAIVTGGSRGIGFAIASKLVKEKYNLNNMCELNFRLYNSLIN